MPDACTNGKKVKVFYGGGLWTIGLVPGMKHHSPDCTQLPPGAGCRTCSLISHLNSPGSLQPGFFWRMELLKHRNLHCQGRRQGTRWGGGAFQ